MSEKEISIYEEVMDSLYKDVHLKPHEKELVEKYKDLYYLRFEYYYGFKKIKNLKDFLNKIKKIESEMDKIISTETIQKMLLK